MTALELATTDELIEELERRHAAVVVIREDDTADDGTVTSLRFSGGLSRAVGMTSRAHHEWIADSILERREAAAADGDEDTEEEVA